MPLPAGGKRRQAKDFAERGKDWPRQDSVMRKSVQEILKLPLRAISINQEIYESVCSINQSVAGN
jgi:hypothetical protein